LQKNDKLIAKTGGLPVKMPAPLFVIHNHIDSDRYATSSNDLYPFNCIDNLVLKMSTPQKLTQRRFFLPRIVEDANDTHVNEHLSDAEPFFSQRLARE
jgi:hypothetical protein